MENHRIIVLIIKGLAVSETEGQIHVVLFIVNGPKYLVLWFLGAENPILSEAEHLNVADCTFYFATTIHDIPHSW